MTYTRLTKRRLGPFVAALALLGPTLLACGGGSGSDDGGGGSGGITGPAGCLTPNFAGEPDIIVFPFIEDRTLNPGGSVEFSMFVDAETRLVRATLMDAWRLRDNAQGMSETSVQNTLGNEMLEFAIPIQTTGRYYVDLELCGASCEELRVVYTLNRENAGPGSDAINDPYERIVYEADAETRSDFTCDNPDSIAIQ